MKWLTEEKLSIINEEASDEESSGSVELRINKEIYHDAGLTCTSLIMKKDYEACYQQ